MAIRDKTTTNKWTYERSHKSLNSYSLVEYNKIYPDTISWKTWQEESLWQVEFDNLYLWNTLNKTHQGILVWKEIEKKYPMMLSIWTSLHPPLFFFAYFSFKQIMHGHIRDRKEIPNDVKHLTFHFCYTEAYRCHFMIGGQ